MAHFKVSAPGKIILYGEHAVVYGKTAIAASLDLRTTLEFEELVDAQELIKLSFPKIHLCVNIPIKKVQNFFFDNIAPECKNNHNTLYEHVQQFVSGIAYSNQQQKMSLEAVFYLLIRICHKEECNIKPFQVYANSTMSISSGLGSSASFAVCLSACFVYWARLQNNIQSSLDLNEIVSKEIVSQYALECEKIMHGTPSGIDNTVCTYGSIVEFKKNVHVKPIVCAKNMKILLVDTRVQRNTRMLVQKVFDLKQKYPAIINPIFESIDNISKEAINIIKKIQVSSVGNNEDLLGYYRQLMMLTNINQCLLASCGVSHPSLDRICTEAQNYALGAKLTGAGGGGYAYILLSPDTEPETISSISRKLIADGYPVTLTSLGCSGVQIYT